MKTLIPKTTVWYIFVAFIAAELLIDFCYTLRFQTAFFFIQWLLIGIFLLKSFVISYSVGQFVPFKKLSKGGIIAIALLCLVILPIINYYNFWRTQGFSYDEFYIQNLLIPLGLNIIVGILLGMNLHRITKKEEDVALTSTKEIVTSFWIEAILLGIIMIVGNEYQYIGIIIELALVNTFLGILLAQIIPFKSYTKSKNLKLGFIISTIFWVIPILLLLISPDLSILDFLFITTYYVFFTFFPALISAVYLAKKLQKLGKTP